VARPICVGLRIWVESDEDDAVSDFTLKLQEILEWLKGNNTLLKNTEMPEDLLAYGVEIDLGRNQLGEVSSETLHELVNITLFVCKPHIDH